MINKSKRIAYVDILKGICITSISFTHASFLFLPFYNLFFISAFYFVSGVTFRDGSPMDFILRKIKGLYVPFVIVNISALIIDIIWKYLSFGKFHGWAIYGTQILKIICFNLVDNRMVSGWFVLPLFIISIIFFILHKAIKRDIILAFITFSFYIITCVCNNMPAYKFFYNHCAILSNIGIGLFIYNLGYLYRRYEDDVKQYLNKFGGGVRLFYCACA